MGDSVLVVQWLVWMAGLAGLAIYAQLQKIKTDELAKEVLKAYEWVDEIIKALEDPDKSRSDERVDSLVAERNDVR